MSAGGVLGRLAAVLLLAAGLPAQRPDPVRLAADPWPPYNLDTGDGGRGLMVDAATLAFEAGGLQVTYIVVGWSRAVSGTRDGLFDGAVGASAVDGEGLVFPSTVLAPVAQGLACRTTMDWRWSGERSLDGFVLGAISGYDYGPEINGWIDRHGSDPRLVQLQDGEDALEANLRKLAAGRVDLVVDAHATLHWTIGALGLDSVLTVVDRLGRVTPCTIAFTPSERGERLARLLDEGCALLEADGRLDSLRALYGLEPAGSARR